MKILLTLILILQFINCQPQIEEKEEVQNVVIIPTLSLEDCPIGEPLDYYKWRDDFRFQRLREGHVESPEFLSFDYQTGSFVVEDLEANIIACGTLGPQVKYFTGKNREHFKLESLNIMTLEKSEEFTNCEIYYIYDGVTSHTPNVPENESLMIFYCAGMGVNELAYTWISWGSSI